MKSYFFTFFALIFLFSCKKENETSTKNWVIISKNIRFKEAQKNFLLKSGNHQYQIDKSKLPFKKIILLNASLVGYITELGEEKKIIGVSSPEYIYSDKIRQFINSNVIQNIGNEQKYDVEKIIALKPDAVFTNYVASFENTYEILKKNGIEVIFIDEYVEEKPLDKVAIIKVFGELLGNEEKAVQRYSEIEKNYKHYKELVNPVANKPSVLTNEMYGSQWFVAGGKSQLAHFIQDAGGSYIFGQNDDSNSTPKSFEEVYATSQNAEFWVNVGNHQNKKELLGINPNYAKMKVYQKSNIYTISGRVKGSSNDYFESGVVRADLVLKDYIKIFHPDIFPKDSLKYILKLK